MTSTELVKYEPRNWVALMAPAVELAKHVSDTAFVPKGLRGNAPAIVAAIMYGDEVGLGPMQALAKIAVIDGRPSLSAEAQRALILAAGHDLWVVESTNTKVTVAGRRSGSEHTSTITWTLDDAKRAGLAGRQNWRSYPRQMLMARATAELARLIFADAVGGLLATEELEDGDVAEDAAPQTTKRKRQSTASPETTSRVAPESNGAEPELPPLPGEGMDALLTGSASPPIDDDIPFGDEPVSVDDPGAPPPPHEVPDGGTSTSDEAPRVLKPTTRQKNQIGVLLKKLRDEHGVITTEQIWRKLASARDREVEYMILGLGGRDEDDVLHFGPLLADLTRPEAARLIDWLERVEARKVPA